MKIEGEGAKNKFLKEWKHPKPELAKLIKQRLAGDQNGENGQSGEAGPSKIEYELPTEGNECEGLVITFLGQGIPSEAKVFFYFIYFYFFFFLINLIYFYFIF